MDFSEVVDLGEFRRLVPERQLDLIEQLLRESPPEVKYRFHYRICDITKYDIISATPHEINEAIFLYLDLNSLLRCRLVSWSWNARIHKCDIVWAPFLHKYSIQKDGFCSLTGSNNRTPEFLWKFDRRNLNVIGERIFDLARPSPQDLPISDPHTDAYSFIMGRKLIANLKNQAGFQLIIDHDSRGSNVSMAMNSEIVAYAREDRHVVIKYSTFPHKKINIFEAHQCADVKIHGELLITAGYDRTVRLWRWRTGEQVACLEGAVKPVYSVDVAGDTLLSSDGKDVVTWDLSTYTMLQKTRCSNDAHLQEVKVVTWQQEHLVVTRSSSQLSVWRCLGSGELSFLADLVIPDRTVTSFQPFVHFNGDEIACSCEHGVCVWSLRDFSLVRRLQQKLCPPCAFNQQPGHTTSTNCRVILLHYSRSVLVQYLVHKNKFQMIGVHPGSRAKINWKFPSDEKWPWSHRKPGIACSIQNADSGLSMTTKITMFVATQAKKIYCTFFDASDFDYTTTETYHEDNSDFYRKFYESTM